MHTHTHTAFSTKSKTSFIFCCEAFRDSQCLMVEGRMYILHTGVASFCCCFCFKIVTLKKKAVFCFSIVTNLEHQGTTNPPGGVACAAAADRWHADAPRVRRPPADWGCDSWSSPDLWMKAINPFSAAARTNRPQSIHVSLTSTAESVQFRPLVRRQKELWMSDPTSSFTCCWSESDTLTSGGWLLVTSCGLKTPSSLVIKMGEMCRWSRSVCVCVCQSCWDKHTLRQLDLLPVFCCSYF